MSTLKKITANSTYSVRNPVLRPNLPIETCHFEGDHLSTTTHFGYYFEEKLVGIVSVFEKSNPNWADKKQIQIRGMAVLEDFQKRGIGHLLLQHVIAEAKKDAVELIWFNARKNAVPFYEKTSFQIFGNAFTIEGVGIHYEMCRLL